MTSGVTEYNKTGAAIVERAFNHIGVKQQGQSIQAEDAALGLDLLNSLIKSWQREGSHLWKDKEAALFLEKTRRTYTLGKQQTRVGDTTEVHTVYATSGDWVQTTTTAASAASASTIDITSWTSYAGVTFDTSAPGVSTMKVGVENEDGDLDWYTVDSVSSLEITITTTITTAVESGAHVYVYYSAEQLEKPLKIYPDNMRLYQSSTNELPIWLLAWSDYTTLPDKVSTGTTVQAFYSPDIDNTELAVWPPSSTVENVLLFRFQSPFDIFNVGTDDQDMPNEWIRPLEWALAAELGQAFGLRTDRQMYLDQKAASLYMQALEWDQDNTSLFLSPRML